MADKEQQSRTWPEIDEDCCKGCARCTVACPRKCLRMTDKFNAAGIKPVEYIGSGCIGCAICFYNCPEPYAIRVHKA